MRNLSYAIAGAAALALIAGPAFAESSKFAAHVSEATLVVLDDTNFTATDVLSIDIKTSNKADLLIGVSLETMIFTKTRAKSKKAVEDVESATGTIDVCVDIDGQSAHPACVRFDHRAQTLSALLGGIIGTCEDTGTFTVVANACVETGTDVPDGKITVLCECDATDEEIELILDTTSAHHFNFIAGNLSSGEHTVNVSIDGTVAVSSTDSVAMVGVGQGSLTVEQVRAVNSGDGIVISP